MHHRAITQFPSPIRRDLVTSQSKEEKKTAIAHHIRKIMEILGLDVEDPSLRCTPDRVATMYVDEIFFGLDIDAFPDVSLFDDQTHTSTSGRLIVTKTRIVSFCEHHLVPMIGTAYISYLPREQIIGLSKISRIAQYFAARPQIQERLTAQIGDSLATILGHQDVAVQVTARHTCVAARGAKDEDAATTTLFTSGAFQTSPDLRREFLEACSHIHS